MENKGLVWASDRAPWRLQKLKRRAARAGIFNYRTAFWNGRAQLSTKTKFDGVLVDAPCSGIGTWQRNPHARWTTTPQDVHELSQLQKRLVSNAAASVKPGGKLYYAVCTLARVETDDVVTSFEKENPEFGRLEIQNPFEKQKTSSSQLRLWPQDYHGNGMFVAGWVKE
jgi:16S rRNA (cytosine967-C5)-methyltransferase